MKIVYFTHSLRSCWNHGNAHFVRGVVRALVALGHDVDVVEPEDGWSLTQLKNDRGEEALGKFFRAFPDLNSQFYRPAEIEAIVDGADVVIAHEWTERDVLASLGSLRRRGSTFRLLFHDTHHRAVSDPTSIERELLQDFDAVLAFGESLSDVYRGWGFTAFTWHEAADTSHFYPRHSLHREGVVWIGNWGDGERTEELETYLFRPVQEENLALTIRGVRYPENARARLREIGAHYGGWIANVDAPDLFAHHLMTVHVPRRFYVENLPGIPTIRMFEALACGIPLVSAAWPDDEGLFRKGDYLIAHSGEEMRRHLRALKQDAGLRHELAERGRETILARHSCAHRAAELIAIVESLDAPRTERGAA
jgi:spore maturation protein CgeB